MTSSFITIPPELQVRILCNLDAVSLARCAMTCQCLNDILKNSSSLMCIIQLYFDGLKDAENHIPAADAVALLLHRRQAWQSLEWTADVAFEKQHDGRVCELVGDALAYINKGHLEIVRLRTLKADKKHPCQRIWNGTIIPCFAMDPSQDLLVQLDDAPSSLSTSDTAMARVHIGTISGDGPHPLALKDSFEFSFDITGFSSSSISDKCATLQIAHNILALCFQARFMQEGIARVLIWDWTTSDLLLDTGVCLDRSSSDFGGCSISLLDSTHCLFAFSSDSGSIRLYKFDRSASVHNTTGAHLATFHLPPMSRYSSISQMTISTEPILVHPPPHAPFLTNDDDRIHVFEIRYDYWHPEYNLSDDGVTDIASIFVHQRVFTKYILQQSHTGGPPLDIPWVEWGPLNTRLIFSTQERPLRCSRRFVHGQRVVFLSGDSSPTSIDVLDFSRAAVISANGHLRTPPALSGGTGHGKLSSSTSIKASDGSSFFFSEDIETHLPYVCTMQDLEEEYSEFMIHADGIVGVQIHNEESSSIHVYTF